MFLRGDLNILPPAYLLASDLYIHLNSLFSDLDRTYCISLVNDSSTVLSVPSCVLFPFLHVCLGLRNCETVPSLHDTLALSEHLRNYSSQPRHNEFPFTARFNLPSVITGKGQRGIAPDANDLDSCDPGEPALTKCLSGRCKFLISSWIVPLKGSY